MIPLICSSGGGSQAKVKVVDVTAVTDGGGGKPVGAIEENNILHTLQVKMIEGALIHAK